MTYSSQQYINPPAYRARGARDVPLPQADVVGNDPGWGEQVMGKGRMAVDALLGAIDPFRRTEGGQISGLRTGRVGGAGTILALLAAANELNDPNESAGRNAMQAGGSLVGSLGGQALGGLAGRVFGGAAAGSVGGPVTALVGATLGGLLGSGAGRSLGDLAANVVEGSPEDRALRAQQKQARAMAEAEAERLQLLMPIQEQAAQSAIRNQASLAEIGNEQMLRRAMAESLLAQQQAGAQQALAMTNAILGRA